MGPNRYFQAKYWQHLDFFFFWRWVTSANIVLLVQGLVLTHSSIPTPVSTTVRLPYLIMGSVTATAAAHFIVMKISEKFVLKLKHHYLMWFIQSIHFTNIILMENPSDTLYQLFLLGKSSRYTSPSINFWKILPIHIIYTSIWPKTTDIWVSRYFGVMYRQCLGGGIG